MTDDKGDRVQTPTGYVPVPPEGAVMPANSVVVADEEGVAIYMYRDADPDRPAMSAFGPTVVSTAAKNRRLDLVAAFYLPYIEADRWGSWLHHLADRNVPPGTFAVGPNSN